MGIPLSRLEGAERTERTRHRYDDDGRLVESVTTRSAEWSAADRQWVLALVEYRTQICPLCGGWLEDCAFPDGTEDKPTFKVPDPMPCQRSVVLNVRRTEHAKHPHAAAMLWSTETIQPRG